MLEIYAR